MNVNHVLFISTIIGFDKQNLFKKSIIFHIELLAIDDVIEIAVVEGIFLLPVVERRIRINI